MEKERKFALKLQELLQLAKTQGNQVSEEQVKEVFTELSLEEEKLLLVYDYLKQHKIGIGEAVVPEDYLTEDDKHYLDYYLEEIEGLGDCTAAKKEAVIRSAIAGDKAAAEKLVELYLPQVVQVAKLYAGQGVLLEDLIGEGNVALILGVRMLACAESTEEAEGMLGKLMMDTMETCINENLEVSEIDKKVVDKINGISAKAKEIAESIGGKVTVSELVRETDFTEEEILEAIEITANNLNYIER